MHAGKLKMRSCAKPSLPFSLPPRPPAVDLEGQPFSGVAATLAALQLLLAAFASTPTLDHLAVSLRSSALGDMPVYQLSQLSRAWGAHVVQGLGQLLTLNPALRCVLCSAQL